MGLFFERIAALKVATAPSPYHEYGSVRCSLSPCTSSQITTLIDFLPYFIPDHGAIRLLEGVD